MLPVRVFAAALRAITSGRVQLNSDTEGARVRPLPSWRRVLNCPPIAYESLPEATSLKVNWVAAKVMFFTDAFFRLNENFSLNPSGFKSLSMVSGVRAHVLANFPPVSCSHLLLLGW